MYIFTFHAPKATYSFRRTQQRLEDNSLAYIDDILLYTKDEEEHTKLIEKEFKILRDHNMVIPVKKSQFYCTEVEC